MRQQSATYNSEQTMTDAVLNRDKNSFSLVYDKYATAVFGVIYRITGNQKLSEHLLQQCFCEFWNSDHTSLPLKPRVFTQLVCIAGSLARQAVAQKQGEAGEENNFTGSNEENNKFVPASTQSMIDLIYIKGYNFSEAGKRTGFCDIELKTRLQSEIGALRLAVK